MTGNHYNSSHGVQSLAILVSSTTIIYKIHETCISFHSSIYIVFEHTLALKFVAIEPTGVDTCAVHPEFSLAWLRKDSIYIPVKKIYICFEINIRGHARTLDSQVAVTYMARILNRILGFSDSTTILTQGSRKKAAAP